MDTGNPWNSAAVSSSPTHSSSFDASCSSKAAVGVSGPKEVANDEGWADFNAFGGSEQASKSDKAGGSPVKDVAKEKQESA